MDINKCNIRNKVDNITIEYNTNIITHEHEAYKLIGLPEKLHMYSADCYIILKNVSTTIANAIRRKLIEVEGHCFVIDEITKLDCVKETLELILNQIPLCLFPVGESFSLQVKNTLPNKMDVYSKDIENYEGACYGSYFILSLPINGEIDIKIKIEKGRGNAKYQLISCTGLETLDVKKSDNIYLSYEQSTLISDPLEHKINFHVNTLKSKDEIKVFISDAIKELIADIKELKNVKYELNKDTLILKFNDTQTLSELIKKTAFDITNNEITYINYEFDHIKKISTLTIKNHEPDTILSNTFDKLIEIFNKILISFK